MIYDWQFLLTIKQVQVLAMSFLTKKVLGVFHNRDKCQVNLPRHSGMGGGGGG